MKRLLTQTLMSALLITGFSLQAAKIANGAELAAVKKAFTDLQTDPQLAEALAQNQGDLAADMVDRKLREASRALPALTKFSCYQDSKSDNRKSFLDKGWLNITRSMPGIYEGDKLRGGKITKDFYVYEGREIALIATFTIAPKNPIEKDYALTIYTIASITFEDQTAQIKTRSDENQYSCLNSFWSTNIFQAAWASLYFQKRNRVKTSALIGATILHLGLIRSGKYENGLLDVAMYLNTPLQKLAKVWS